MARMVYNNSPLGGLHLATAMRFTMLARQEVTIAMDVANSLTGNGATPSALEGSVEFGIATGQGSAFYTELSNFYSYLLSLSAGTSGDLWQG